MKRFCTGGTSTRFSNKLKYLLAAAVAAVGVGLTPSSDGAVVVQDTGFSGVWATGNPTFTWNTTTSTATTPNPLAFTAASDGMLIVTFGGEINLTGNPTATYNGIPMTLAKVQNSGGQNAGGGTAIFYLADPTGALASGGTVSITANNSNFTRDSVSAMYVTGVAGLGNTAGASVTNSASVTTTINANAGDLVVSSGASEANPFTVASISNGTGTGTNVLLVNEGSTAGTNNAGSGYASNYLLSTGSGSYNGTYTVTGGDSIAMATFVASLTYLPWSSTPGSNDWATGTNWVGNAAPTSATGAVFNSASTITTVNVAGTVVVGAIRFDTASANAYTLGSSAGSGTISLAGNSVQDAANVTVNATVTTAQTINANLNLANTANSGADNYTITNNGTALMTIAGGIDSNIAGNKTLTFAGTGSILVSGTIASSTGTLAVAKNGTGTVTLAAANSYAGATNINVGKIQLNVDGALGTAAGGTNVTATGAALALNGLSYNTAEPLSLIGTGVGGTGALVNIGTSSYAGAVTIGAGGATIGSGTSLNLTGGVIKNGVTATFVGGGTVTITGTGISGASANSDVVVSGSTLSIGAASTYNGATFIRNGGIINANVTDALPTANGRSAVTMDDTGSGSSNLTLGVNQSIASLTGAATSTVNLGGNTLTIGAASGSTTFAGVISAGSVIKDNNSTLTLSGANTYGGTTTVKTGSTLIVTGSLVNSDVSVNGGGTFKANTTGSTTVQSLSVSNDTTGGILTPRVSGTTGNLTLAVTNALTLANGSILNLTLGSPGNTDLITAGSLNLTGTTTLNIVAGAGFATGTYTLISGFGAGMPTTGDHTNFSLNALPPLFSYVIKDFNNGAAAGTIQLTATAAPQITWNNTTTDGQWNTTSSNWTGDSTFYADGTVVTFGATAAGAVNIPSNIAPSQVTIAAGAYTFTGPGAITNSANTFINSGASLSVSSNATLGAGTVTIGQASPTTAATLTLAGGLTINASGPGSFPIVVANVNSAIVGTGGTTTINSVISGAGNLNLTGAFVLGGSNTFTGITSLTAGSSVSVAAIAGTGTAQPLGKTSVALGNGASLTYTGSTAATNLPIAITTAGSVIINNAAAQSLTLSGNITGGAVRLSSATTGANASTFILSGTGSTSPITIGGGTAGSGTVSIGAANNLGSATTLTLDGGTLFSATNNLAPGKTINIATGGGTLLTPPPAAAEMSLNSSSITGSGPLTLNGFFDLESGSAQTYSGTLTFATNTRFDINLNFLAGVTNIIWANNVGNVGLQHNTAFNTAANIEFQGAQGGQAFYNGTGTYNFSGALTSDTGADNSGFTNNNNGYGGMTLSGATDNTSFSLTVAGPTTLAKTSSPTVHAIGGQLYIFGVQVVKIGGTGDYQIADTARVRFNAATSTLDLNGNNVRLDYTISETAAAGLITNSAAGTTGTVIWGSNNFALNPATGTNTFGGIIQNGAPTAVTALNKVGTGTLTLNGVNTYTGNTNITSGKLVIGAGGSIGAGGQNITVNGNLNVNGSVVAGTGGSVLIGATGTLSGSGTIGKPIAFSGVGGKIAPGNSPGILSTGNQTWTNGNSYVWEINNWTATPTAGTDYDQTAITGALDISALSAGSFPTNSFQIAVTGLTGANAVGAVPGYSSGTTRSWNIATFSGGIIGTFDPTLFTIDTSAFAPNNPLGTGVFSLTADSTHLILNFVGGAPSFIYTDASATAVNVLVGAAPGSGSVTKTIQNNGTATGDSALNSVSNLSVAVAGSLTGVAAGDTRTLTLSATSSAAYGSTTGTLSVTPNGGANAVNVTVNVGNAKAADSGANNLAAFDPLNKMSANVAAATSYVNLASKVTSGTAGFLGTEAVIVQGANAVGGTETVGMNWRNRATVEKPGTASAPPIPYGAPAAGLIADVVDLTGLVGGLGRVSALGDRVESDVYALQMSYDQTLLLNEASAAANGYLRLVWLNTEYDGVAGASANDMWFYATDGNFGANTTNPAYLNVQESWGLFASSNGVTDSNLGSFLGAYGVDTTSHTVWAVLDHDAQFSVVPEPASLGLLAVGALGLLRRRR